MTGAGTALALVGCNAAQEPKAVNDKSDIVSEIPTVEISTVNGTSIDLPSPKEIHSAPFVIRDVDDPMSKIFTAQISDQNKKWLMMEYQNYERALHLLNSRSQVNWENIKKIVFDLEPAIKELETINEKIKQLQVYGVIKDEDLRDLYDICHSRKEFIDKDAKQETWSLDIEKTNALKTLLDKALKETREFLGDDGKLKPESQYTINQNFWGRVQNQVPNINRLIKLL